MRRFYDSLLALTEKYYWIFFTLAAGMLAFLCFRCLGVAQIDSWDEARHGVSAYEMMRNGDFLVNTYLGQPDYWNVKPPLSFLTVAAGFAIFGYNTVGLRFFSALFYLTASVCAGLFARRHSRLASLLAMVFLCANYFPFKAHLARAGDADSLYLLLFTLAMLSMLKIRQNQRWLYVCGLCFSLAFLTKSFHALMIAAVGGLFLLFTGELKKMRAKTWGFFLVSALLPLAVWALLRYQYDGMTFFRHMYEADIAGRTAAGGLEGHGAPFLFYITSVFWNFDYSYGWLSLIVLLGAAYLYFRPLRRPGTPLPAADLAGFFLWLLVPLLGFSLISTKLMWYVYPCTVPLCLLAAVFLAEFLRAFRIPTGILGVSFLAVLGGSAFFVWNNYLDNVRGAHSNALQTFIMEQFSREDALAGAAVYLDAYDPFLYANTSQWEQNNLLLAMLEGDLQCRDGGAEAFLADEEDCLLILSIPFLEDHPALLEYQILADNGQYLLLSNAPAGSGEAQPAREQ